MLIAATLGAALLTQLAGPSPTAHAWSEKTHEEMARQSVLYMLRSSNPTLRFVGTVMTAGGEGSRATPTGERGWRLSSEARLVDHYEDVTLKNTASTPGNLGFGDAGNLFHEFMGNNFTAFNHFLLYEHGGHDTSAWSYDSYPLGCGELIYDEELGALRERNFDEGDMDDACGQFCDTDNGGAGSGFSSDGHYYNCNDVFPNGRGRTWMRMHDNFSGYSAALDSSLGGGIDANGIPSQGQLLRLAGSNQDFEDFCEAAFYANVDIDDLTDLPWWLDILTLSLGDNVFEEIVEEAVEYVAAMCPSVEGYGTQFSSAMNNYRNNSSTYASRDFHKVSMIDIRWHPVDNLVAFGEDDFRRNLHRFQPIGGTGHDPAPCPPSVCSPQPGDGHKPTNPSSSPYDLPSAVSAPQQAQALDARPSRIGRLQALGRVMHGMSDLAVPGHITGALLGSEHLHIEDGANHFVGLFDDYLGESEEVTVTGAVQGSPFEVGSLHYALDALIDVDAANEKILEMLDSGSAITIERLAEDAAKATRLAFLQDSQAGRFETEDDINGALRREYLTRALINNVIGAVHSMRGYYDDNSTSEWSDIIADVSWTEHDSALIEQPSSDGGEFPVPTFIESVVGGYQHNLNIDFNYKEFVETAGCYVENHDWCNDVGEGDEWRPCAAPKDARSIPVPTLAMACTSSDCDGPAFVDSFDLTRGIILSSSNVGRDGDDIHVTGTFTAGESNVEYFRGALTANAGEFIELPASSNENGVAIWCTGSDISQERVSTEDAQNSQTDAICEFEEIEPLGALDCDRQERAIWRSRLKRASRSPTPTTVLPTLPASAQEGDLDMASIAVLATRFDTSTDGLSKALESAAGKVVKLVEPSPWGRASLVWSDDDGVSNVTTIKNNGGIVTTRTTAPILLPTKSQK